MTVTSLFLTGASGFVGQALLKKLDPKQFDEICCLSRRELATPELLAAADNFRVIQGDLLDPPSYAPFLSEGGTVLHLAALTRKAQEDDFFRINTEGTRRLLSECKNAGTNGFLYVSSIAVKFADISGYPYARSKVLAETAVRESGLEYTIVRPTIVIGRNAQILQSLASLGKPPIIPMLGNGHTKIQPIYVDDLADCLLTLVCGGAFSSETIDLGGPEQVSMEDFVRIVRAESGKKPPLGVVHLPLKPLSSTLRVMEKLGMPLPFSSAQLSSFANDGTAESNPVQTQHAGTMKNVREMIGLSLARS